MKKKQLKTDLRVEKTIHSIKETFIELVEQKGFQNISVSEITKRCNINRNTFYLHYGNIDELAKGIITDTSIKMVSMLKRYSRSSKMTLMNISEIELRWGTKNILKNIEPYSELYRIYFLDEMLKGYITNLFDTVKKYLAVMLNIKNPKSNMIFEYTFSGMYGYIVQWISYSTTPASEAAKILSELMYSNLQEFKTIN